jgi:hypothetical protein
LNPQYFAKHPLGLVKLAFILILVRLAKSRFINRLPCVDDIAGLVLSSNNHPFSLAGGYGRGRGIPNNFDPVPTQKLHVGCHPDF